MAITVKDFIPGTPLLAADMDALVANDVGLANGTNIGAGAITTNTLANGAVTAPKIDFSTLTVGFAEKTTTQTHSSTTTAAISGLSSSVSVPAGGANLKITIWIGEILVAGGNSIVIAINDNGTPIAYYRQTISAANFFASATVIARKNFSAGTHVFSATVNASSTATVTLQTNSSNPGIILVERN